MLYNIMQIDIIYKIIINTILNSIPEELFVVLFTYILMGEFDQWKDEDCKRLFQPWDYSRIIVPTVATALISNVLRYTGANEGIVSFGTLLAFFITIVAMGDIFNNARALKWMGEVLVFLLLAALCVSVIELTYLPFMVYGTGKPLAEINNNMLHNFIISIPAKIMEYSLLAFLVLHKRSLLKARIIKMVFESKILTAFMLTTLLADFSFLVFMLKIVCYESVLSSLSVDLRLVVFVAICIFPVFNISALIWCTYFINNREATNKKKASDRIKKIMEKIQAYSEKANYDDIVWTLNGLNANLGEVADDLFGSNNKKGGE